MVVVKIIGGGDDDGGRDDGRGGGGGKGECNGVAIDEKASISAEGPWVTA